MLTPEQQKAVTSKAKKILVRAGAGTGKTEVLTRRVIHLLEQDTLLSIQHFALITFTNKATEEVQDRLKQYLYHKWSNEESPENKDRYRYELEMLNKSQVSTIHSFCKSILDLAGPFTIRRVHYAPGYKVSEGVLYEAMNEVLERWLKRYGSDQPVILKYIPLHQVRKEVLSLYKKINSDGNLLEKVKTETETSILLEEYEIPRKIKHELLTILVELDQEHFKRKIKQLSTDDLLEYTYRLLKEYPEVIQRVQQRYKHLFVDEFQDTSWFQTKILQLICQPTGEEPSLFVVGDIKQSIYQFRGANIESYQDVATWIKAEGEILTLKTNFRSLRPIVEYVNQMFLRIKNNVALPQFEAEDLVAHDQTIGKTEDFIKYISLDGYEDAERVALFIKEQIHEGEEYGDYAILFRTNRNMAKFEEVLNRFEIPTQMVGAGNFYHKKEIIDAYRLLNWLVTPEDPIKQSEALVTDYLRGSPTLMAELIVKLEQTLDKYTVAQILEVVYRETNIRSHFELENRYQALANIEKLKEVTRSLNQKETIQLVDYVHWLSKKIMIDQEEQQAEILDLELNAVTLITVHKVKGLEFPYVILPELNRNLTSIGLIPSVLYDLNTGIEFSFRHYVQNWTIQSSNYENLKSRFMEHYLAEEVRVLYVAVTRAEKRLYFIKYDDKKKTGKHESYEKWLGEGIGELERKRVDYEAELEALLEKRQNPSSSNSSKWKHQIEAKVAFLASKNGILEMATGTGKTRTAIEIVKHLFEERKIESVIITVNGTDLLDQWYKEIVKHTSLQVYRHYDTYKQIGSFQSFPEDSVLIVSRLALKEALQYLMDSTYEKTMIICDEVHGLGSPALQRDVKGKIQRFRYRLGLSATPEREYDEEGNQFIESEIGPVIYRFGLADAIRKGILCEFEYYPLSFKLTPEDHTKIRSLIANHYAKKRAGERVSDEMLFSDLARVRKTSAGKIEPFSSFIQNHPHLLKRSIVFVETKEFGLHIQQLILPYIRNYHTYYGEDNRNQLERFSADELDCLITSKRISEGIDIQSVENVILFTADRAELQTIQRIGRCLRTDPINPHKRANVIDFIEEKTDAHDQDDVLNEEQTSADQKRKVWLMKLAEVNQEGKESE